MMRSEFDPSWAVIRTLFTLGLLTIDGRSALAHPEQERETDTQVVAFSTPAHAEWRWRIVADTGHLVEESYGVFPSIAAAVADGALRRRALGNRDIASMSGRNRRPCYRRGG